MKMAAAVYIYENSENSANYNSAIDQIKYLPPSWIETLDFIQVSTCWRLARECFKLIYLPPPPPPPSYLHESNSKRAQAGIYVGNRNTELSSPSSSAWWFQKEDKKVRQTLQRNSSWAKAYPRPHHSKDGFAWETIIVLINRNKSLKRERKKKLHHLSFYIYKLRNLQWERGK